MGVVLVDGTGTPVQQARTYPCNREAESLFRLCETQWDRNGLTGDLVRLSYPGVETTARLSGIEITPDLFFDLQCIEIGALGGKARFPELDAVQILDVGFDDEQDSQNRDPDHW